jgi:hypothetical protein
MLWFRVVDGCGGGGGGGGRQHIYYYYTFVLKLLGGKHIFPWVENIHFHGWNNISFLLKQFYHLIF